MQAEVTTLSQQVGLYDHRRAIRTAENVLLKQKLTSLGQKLTSLGETQRFKEDGELLRQTLREPNLDQYIHSFKMVHSVKQKAPCQILLHSTEGCNPKVSG
ncbi:unnamed protein product [Sphagnum troendelagicum]|uniref:Uncharacterized protein n=1 Tax=Sphagnum troendelagicum TaxID=128251 RepID=A0ABP0TEW6_9BRYO